MAFLDAVSVRRRVFVLGVLMVLGTASAALAGFSNPPTDQWLYLQIRESGFLSGLDAVSFVHTAPFVALLALVALLGWRCRALMAFVVLSLLAGLGVAVLLELLVARPRPFDSPVTGTDSFPSPTVLLLSILVVLVPVAVRVLVDDARVWGTVRAALAVLVVLAGLHEVHEGLRWPLDVGGAFVTGIFIGLAARLALQAPLLHDHLHSRCDGCPWQGAEHVPHVLPEVSHRQRRAHPLYRAAVVSTAGLTVVLTYLAVTRGIPRLPESGVMGSGMEVPLNAGFTTLMLLGLLVAARWHVAGTSLVALFGMLLGYASSVQYAPWAAAAITLAALLPAFLLWVQWHRVATIRAALSVATVASVLLGVVVYFASTNYSTYWGPTHPVSTTPAPARDVVQWMWAGAVTSTSVNVRARTVEDADAVRLVVGRGSDLKEAAYSPPVPSGSARENVVSLTVSGLAPGTGYHYALEVDGEVARDRVQTFSTFPEGPASFTFATASCSRTGSSGKVFDAIRRTDPLLYLNVGDWFYADIDRNDPSLFRTQYEANLTAPAQAALYGSTAFAYVWDDHDYDGNDGDSSAVSKPAAMQVYRQYAPHYPLRGGDEAPLFQAFTVGDVRFVLTDPRSARVPAADGSGTMLGEEQRGWLLDELSQADQYGLVVWANGAPWVDRADPTTDTWGGFALERRMIADAIAAYDVDNLLMVSGDAHMLGYDDGTHSDFSTSGGTGFPVLHAAALDRKGSIKGGPYTGPVIPGGGQFGTVRVDDDGTRVRVTVAGRNWEGEVLFRRRFTVPR